MQVSDLAQFSYLDCGIKAEETLPGHGVAWPFSYTGGWTLCFQESRDKKLEELRPKWEQDDAAKMKTTPETAPTQDERRTPN
jgi:hypothetical protein